VGSGTTDRREGASGSWLALVVQTARACSPRLILIYACAIPQDAIDNGADVNFQGRVGGDTALHIVCSNINNNDLSVTNPNEKVLDVVKILILAKADLSIKNNVGNTALDIAKRKKYRAVAELLLDPHSVEPPPLPTPPPTPPKSLDQCEGDELLDRAHEAVQRAEQAERRAVEAEHKAAVLEEQNRKLMEELGYKLPDTAGKMQPLQPLQLSAGQGDTRNIDASDISAIQSGSNIHQLQPLQPSATMSIVDVHERHGQRQQLQPSVSAPALPSMNSLSQGPEVLLKQMLQRGDITFKEYKIQLVKLNT